MDVTLLLDDEHVLYADSNTYFFHHRPPSTRIRNFRSGETLRERPFFAVDENCVTLFRGNIVFLEHVVKRNWSDWADPGTTLRLWNWRRDLEKSVAIPSRMWTVHANSTEIVTVDEDYVYFWSPRLRYARNFSLHGGEFAGLTNEFYGITWSDTILYKNGTGCPMHRISRSSPGHILAMGKTCFASTSVEYACGFGGIKRVSVHSEDEIVFSKPIPNSSVRKACFSDSGDKLAVLLEGFKNCLLLHVYGSNNDDNASWDHLATFEFEATFEHNETGEILRQDLDFSLSPSGEHLFMMKHYSDAGTTRTFVERIIS